jgi:hypothetical protein
VRERTEGLPLHGDDRFRDALDELTLLVRGEEAATDPYPFTSWADPLKLPPWEKSEIGDICQPEYDFNGKPQGIAPWGVYTRVVPHGPGVQPYWSNDDGGCVPESRPGAQITFRRATRPLRGNRMPRSSSRPTTPTRTSRDRPSPRGNITWKSDKDGVLADHNYVITTHSLSPGIHHITAEVRGDQYGVRVTHRSPSRSR